MIRQDEFIGASIILLASLAAIAIVVCTALWAPKPLRFKVCTIQFMDGETQEAIRCNIIYAQTARCGDTIYSQFKQITCR